MGPVSYPYFPGVPPQQAVPATPVQESSAPPPPAPPPPVPPPPAPPKVIDTSSHAKDGLSKCEACGATEVSLNEATGKLRCGYCRREWSQKPAAGELNLEDDFTGVVRGSAARDIVASTDDVVTFKCSACGAEVVIGAEMKFHARCHWCRNTLSINQQMPNGLIPDMILPFRLSKQDATTKIERFVRKRRFFAHPKFKREFTTENVIGVFLPYMVVDVNAHASLRGVGEVQTRAYGSSKDRRYDADVYQVARRFHMKIRGLTIESSSARRNQNTDVNTNNVINTILPFDVKNCVRFDARYTVGFNAERRDTDIDALKYLVGTQTKDIARHQANSTLLKYGRGVRWHSETVTTQGQRWMTAYLPVWLYSYYQKKSGGKRLLHYVAVNARTGETMGSIPVNQIALFGVSTVIQAIGTVLGILVLLAG